MSAGRTTFEMKIILIEYFVYDRIIYMRIRYS